ncbi:unnamed protein product [Adineta steineri]|uniref:Uncharacterized protein n=1 Tax=Adineta steineri TaxID=433720 RepID=A0A815M4S0_9BILA|nr:unnamed protein product [Adineta steineri]
MIFNTLYEWFINLNLFKEHDRIEQPDEATIHIQRLSTRVYLLLLIGIITILMVHTALSYQNINRTVQTPNLSTYMQLLNEHPDTLSCLCSRINILFGDFVILTPTFHQVCTSQFISQALIDATYDSLAIYYNPLDIRMTISFQLQLLRSFCQLSESIILDELNDLLNGTELVSARLIDPTLFNTQVQVRITTNLETAISTFIRGLTLVRQTSLSNQLISGSNGDFRFSFSVYTNNIDNSTGIDVDVLACAFQNNNGLWCNCGDTFSCQETGGIYSTDYNLGNLGTFTNNDSMLKLGLPGFVSTCIPLESLLASSLECFYNSTCITQIFPSLNITEQLNAFQTSRYAINTTVEQILQNLMLEQWEPNISFSKFFTQCNITSCTYSITMGNDFLYVITALLGIYGGLTVFLRLIVPHIVKFIVRHLRRQNLNRDILPFSVRLRGFLMRNVNLNLFPSEDSSEIVIHQQRWATRLYLIILISVMTVLMLYSSLTQQIVSQTITTPTQTQYENLVHVYGSAVSCPCSRIAVNLEEDLRSQADILSTNFISSTERSFARELALIRFTTQGNQIITGTYANFGIPVSDETTNGTNITVVDIVPGYFINAEGIPCFCARSSMCSQSMGIYSLEHVHGIHIPYYIIPSFYIGCLLIDSVLQSTLECFYDNNTCLETILSYYANFSVFINITGLNALQSSRFPLNATIETLAYELFVEQWYTNISYASYFASCAPQSCTYTYIQRKSFLNVIISLLSIYGGLSVVLRLIVPLLVNYVMEKIRKRHERQLSPDDSSTLNSQLVNDRLSFIQRLHSLVKWLIDKLMKLNLFKRNNNETMARHMTRLYLIALFVAGLVLISYIELREEPTQVKTIYSPSLDTFKTLLSEDSQLSCPCTNLAVPYSSFIYLNTTFHEVCSSDFVSSIWLDRVLGYAGYDVVADYYPNITDFRRQAVAHFELIQFFCQLVDQTINDALQIFGFTQLVSAQPLQESSFSIHVQSLVQQFQTSTANDFMRSLMLIRQTTQGNAWITMYASSWRLTVREVYPNAAIFMYPVVYGNCSCATYATCTEPAGIYKNETFIALSGFHIGCYPLEAVLQSSLACLYSSACVQLLEFYFPPTTNMTPVRTLTNHQSSVYSVNSTIETLISQLLVEQWTVNISYEAFYKQCAPATCTISFKGRNSLPVIITFLLGIFGGLTIVLKLLVPIIIYIAWMIYGKVRRNRNAIVPIN